MEPSGETETTASVTTSTESISVSGFVENLRTLKNMSFVVLGNARGQLQVTCEHSKLDEATVLLIRGLTVGSTVTIKGELVANPKVRLGGVELLLESIIVSSTAAAYSPITSESRTELLADWRFLSLRFPENQLMMRVQHTFLAALREFCDNAGFLEIHSPKLMHSASESGAELFSLDYFGGKAYLAQSPQFYKQMAMAAGLERVLEIGPVFRAEPSYTSRHATEFISIDLEMSWVTDHHEVMEFEAAMLQHCLQAVHDKHGKAIEKTFGVKIKVPSLPFPEITMEEAQKVLRSLGYSPGENSRKGDLTPEGERLLGNWALSNLGSEFIFVTEYPITIRPFYHRRLDSDSSKTHSFDLLWKGLEVTTGAQREHRIEVLEQQAAEHGLTESVSFYLDFFRHGCPPHGGLGLGLARIIMTMLGLPSIRGASFLFRGPNRLTP